MSAEKKNSWARMRRGWKAMSEVEKQRWRLKKKMDAKALTKAVAAAIVDLIARQETETDLGWKESWVPPQNIIYGRRYTGVNALVLTAQARERGQRDCRFLTRHALGKLKDSNGDRAMLKEGAEPYLVMSPRRGPDRKISAELAGRLTGEEAERVELRSDGYWLTGRLYFSTVRVYSVADTTAAVPPLSAATNVDFRENLFFERLFEALGVRLTHDAGSGAFYHRTEDCIHLPPRESFNSADMYYCTLLHEFYHWTGHSARENRGQSDHEFGSWEYASEELRAELFAAVTCVMFGLKGMLSKSAGYIRLWNETMRDNPKDVIAMAAQVQNLASALYDVADGVQPRIAWMRQADFSRVPKSMAESRRAGMNLESQWRREMGLEDPLAMADETIVTCALPGSRSVRHPAATTSGTQSVQPPCPVLPGRG